MCVGNVVRCFTPRAKLDFPLISVVGSAPRAQFILHGLTGQPNHRRYLGEGGGLRWAVTVNEQVCIYQKENCDRSIVIVL